MADKPEFVDLISEATHQSRRRIAKHVDEPEVKERSRLSTCRRTAGCSGGWRR